MALLQELKDYFEDCFSFEEKQDEFGKYLIEKLRRITVREVSKRDIKNFKGDLGVWQRYISSFSKDHYRNYIIGVEQTLKNVSSPVKEFLQERNIPLLTFQKFLENEPQNRPVLDRNRVLKEIKNYVYKEYRSLFKNEKEYKDFMTRRYVDQIVEVENGQSSTMIEFFRDEVFSDFSRSSNLIVLHAEGGEGKTISLLRLLYIYEEGYEDNNYDFYPLPIFRELNMDGNTFDALIRLQLSRYSIGFDNRKFSRSLVKHCKFLIIIDALDEMMEFNDLENRLKEICKREKYTRVLVTVRTNVLKSPRFESLIEELKQEKIDCSFLKLCGFNQNQAKNYFKVYDQNPYIIEKVWNKLGGVISSPFFLKCFLDVVSNVDSKQYKNFINSLDKKYSLDEIRYKIVNRFVDSACAREEKRQELNLGKNSVILQKVVLQEYLNRQKEGDEVDFLNIVDEVFAVYGGEELKRKLTSEKIKYLSSKFRRHILLQAGQNLRHEIFRSYFMAEILIDRIRTCLPGQIPHIFQEYLENLRTEDKTMDFFLRFIAVRARRKDIDLDFETLKNNIGIEDILKLGEYLGVNFENVFTGNPGNILNIKDHIIKDKTLCQVTYVMFENVRFERINFRSCNFSNFIGKNIVFEDCTGVLNCKNVDIKFPSFFISEKFSMRINQSENAFVNGECRVVMRISIHQSNWIWEYKESIEDRENIRDRLEKIYDVFSFCKDLLNFIHKFSPAINGRLQRNEVPVNRLNDLQDWRNIRDKLRRLGIISLQQKGDRVRITPNWCQNFARIYFRYNNILNGDEIFKKFNLIG